MSPIKQLLSDTKNKVYKYPVYIFIFASLLYLCTPYSESWFYLAFVLQLLSLVYLLTVVLIKGYKVWPLLVFGIILLNTGIVFLPDKEASGTEAFVYSVLFAVAILYTIILIIKNTVSKHNINKFIKKLLHEGDKSWNDLSLEIMETGEINNSKYFRHTGEKIYEHYINKYISDLFISRSELKDLEDIQNYFHLSNDEVITVKNRYNKKAIESLSQVAFDDNVLTEDELNNIYELADILHFPKEKVDIINKNNALKIFNSAKNNAIEDQRLTPEEENELVDLKNNLGLTDDDILTSSGERNELALCKFLWQIENGILPEVQSPVVLTRNEKCHFSIEATRVISKTKTTSYAGGSKGVSVHVTKGVTLRANSFKGHPVREEITSEYPGLLVITSKKIVFIAKKKGFTIPFSKLCYIEGFYNSIDLQKGDTFYSLDLDNAKITGMIIKAAVNNFMMAN